MLPFHSSKKDTDFEGTGNSNYQWRIPLILEAFFPMLVSTILLCYSSPIFMLWNVPKCITLGPVAGH